MFKRIVTAALVFGAAALAPPSAAASTAEIEVAQAVPRPIYCAPREAIAAQLAARFGEARRGAGLQSPTQLVELWTSAESGSWTIILTRADGLSCLLGSGQHWQEDALPSDASAQEEPS